MFIFLLKGNLRSGPFLASPICSLMSSLAKVGPDQKSLKNPGRWAKVWPTKLVIWLAVETPEVKVPSWLRGALAKSSRLIRHKCTKNLLPFVLTMTWTMQLDFICINGDMRSETYHNLSRIGFESLERVKLAIPLSSSVGHVVENTFAQTSRMFWKLNSWFFQMVMKADAYWFPGWEKGHIYQQEERLIKSQVTGMHILNNFVSNGFIYLLNMTRVVCTIWSQDCFIIFPVD